MCPCSDRILTWRRWGWLVFIGVIWVAVPVRAFQPKPPTTPLDQKAFFLPELALSSRNVPLHNILDQLPNRSAWENFLQRYDRRFHVFIDPRSGVPTNIIGPVPMIPGTGKGNHVTLADVSRRLGRRVHAITPDVVGELVLRWIADHRDIFAIDLDQIGPPRVTQVNTYLWQVYFPQVVEGIPVRYAMLVASINHGNMVLIGTENWGNVRIDPTPRISAEAAMQRGFAYIGGRHPEDVIWKEPALEIVPVSPGARTPGEPYTGTVGAGYRHRLVWVFGVRRPPDLGRWEFQIDAHTGEIIAFQDVNHYAKKQIKGGVYPLSSTEICPDAQRCGAMQLDYPMPFADTGLPDNPFTNSAGVFDFTLGQTVTTTLQGQYVRVSDTCGNISESSITGDLDLGGTNGDHDCTSGGTSAGNTPASRSCFYELNKIMEMARGWLPTNAWLQSQLPANVNINATCNAFWDGVSVNFYKSGGGCRNTGEIAAVFDHEWGHGLDDNDANGVISNSGEAYADIAAILRLHASCVGYGFWWTSDRGCGVTSDLTGYNANEAQVGPSHCDLDCSGVRDADWDKHADHTPDTALGFVCNSCSGGSGPCGRQVHCAAAPTRQAAWDLAARDLQQPPFNYDWNTAFMIANRLFYQGSGNVGSWHACTCDVSSDGCGSTNGYMQWLTVDDDNGDLNDGTPHMTALFNAFNRHGIACGTPTPTNSGCSGEPTTPPTLTVTPDHLQVHLSWTPVPGATKYWIFRTEGHAGCQFGKVRIAEVTGTTYTDTEVANFRQYCYGVVAVGSNDACFTPMSTCTCAQPAPGPFAEVTDYRIVDSCPFGGPSDNNGIIEPGETVTLPVTIENIGIADLTNITGTLSTTTTDVTITDDAGAWPDLPIGSSAESIDHFVFQVNELAGCGTNILFSLTLNYDQGSNQSDFAVPLGTTGPCYVCTSNPPDFALSCDPNALTIGAGGSRSTNCTIRSLYNFVNPVSLSCPNAPPGFTCTFSPSTVTPPLNQSAASLLAIQTDSTVPPGLYTVQVQGTDGTIVHTYDIQVTIPDIVPTGLLVDSAPFQGTGTANGNGVLEAGETVIVAPKWQNRSATPVAFSGTAAQFTDDTGAIYPINDNTADYGTIPVNTTVDCASATGDCYVMHLPARSPRPFFHWDTRFRETNIFGGIRTWVMHVGDSFLDVPRSSFLYVPVETLLHYGITAGCGNRMYCPYQTLNRAQMAIFIAIAHAGGDANVPVRGTAHGQSYDCDPNSPTAQSLFADVQVSDFFCRHVHYLFAQNITSGCAPGLYCPYNTISRAQMAIFIARAITGGTIPSTYTDPNTGRSYHCTDGLPNFFTDVPDTAVYCSAVHYLWARGVISGCAANRYCPFSSVNRGQMALFIVRAFGLMLYGP